MKKSKFKVLLKKSACISVALCALAMLSACASLFISDECNPQLTLQRFFEYISNSDYSAAFEMTGNSIDNNVSLSDSELNDVFIRKLSECCDYKLVSDTDAMGLTAWQTVEITTLDMRAVAEKAVDKAVEDAKSHAYKNGSYKTDEEISEAVRNNLIELLPNVGEDCLSTVRLRLKFCYKKGDWNLVMDDDLYDALNGYSKYVDYTVSQ